MSKRRRSRRVPSAFDAWGRDHEEPDARPVELREGTPNSSWRAASNGCSRIRPLYEVEETRKQ